MSCNRAALHRLVTQLEGWSFSRDMFKQALHLPTMVK